ncbi:hypothetical protein PMAYCL1PPCAC_10372, partial [Pristionchus mayeri]
DARINDYDDYDYGFHIHSEARTVIYHGRTIPEAQNHLQRETQVFLDRARTLLSVIQTHSEHEEWTLIPFLEEAINVLESVLEMCRIMPYKCLVMLAKAKRMQEEAIGMLANFPRHQAHRILHRKTLSFLQLSSSMMTVIGANPAHVEWALIPQLQQAIDILQNLLQKISLRPPTA